VHNLSAVGKVSQNRRRLEWDFAGCGVFSKLPQSLENGTIPERSTMRDSASSLG
jgi:hypothetical protein